MGVSLGSSLFFAKSYGRILGAYDRVNAGIVGFSDRAKPTLISSFLLHHQELNFSIVVVSDICTMRREKGAIFLSEETGKIIQIDSKRPGGTNYHVPGILLHRESSAQSPWLK